jgi:hypothetical protein
MNKIRAIVHRKPEVNVLYSRNDKIILSFEIYHPKNNVHNQDGSHDDNKVRITIFFFFELTENDGQNFLAGIVQQAKNHHTITLKIKFCSMQFKFSIRYEKMF